MTLWRKIRAFWALTREIEWVEQPKWNVQDAAELEQFLRSESGERLKLYLRNYVLRQQANALSSFSNLKYSAGLCNGSKNLVGVIEQLAESENFKPDEEESDASPHTNP